MNQIKAFLSRLHFSKAKPIEFAVVVPTYNNGNDNWMRCVDNLHSIVTQRYPHYKVYVIDDCSTDDTGALLDEMVTLNHLENKVFVQHNKERKKALANLYECIHGLDPHVVVVTVDGDDELAPHALERLATAYADKNIWMTYGSYKTIPMNVQTCSKPVPKAIYEELSFRSHPWAFSHLRSFYAKLFQQIHREDLLWNGDFFPFVWDQAIMFPMLEMASQGHIQYISEILYLYSMDNPLSDFLIRTPEPSKVEAFIRGKKIYEPLKKLF
jgi:glycosyltransferase involved in cell wall biosynthesis